MIVNGHYTTRSLSLKLKATMKEDIKGNIVGVINHVATKNIAHSY